MLHKKIGSVVEKGEPLFTVHASEKNKLGEAVASVLAAHVIGDRPVLPLPLFYE